FSFGSIWNNCSHRPGEIFRSGLFGRFVSTDPADFIGWVYLEQLFTQTRQGFDKTHEAMVI
ncbi:MAG: hypothetical protein U0L49_03300, partial [Eubacterium sp.]|nr:hypothetical protein [Eubacterium sp.]